MCILPVMTTLLLLSPASGVFITKSFQSQRLQFVGVVSVCAAYAHINEQSHRTFVLDHSLAQLNKKLVNYKSTSSEISIM